MNRIYNKICLKAAISYCYRCFKFIYQVFLLQEKKIVHYLHLSAKDKKQINISTNFIDNYISEKETLRRFRQVKYIVKV